MARSIMRNGFLKLAAGVFAACAPAFGAGGKPAGNAAKTWAVLSGPAAKEGATIDAPVEQTLDQSPAPEVARPAPVAEAPAGSSDFSLAPASHYRAPQYLAAGAPRRPLMALLDRAGLAKPLDDLRINVYGHVEGGYTYNFQNPRSDQNPFRLFDFQHNKAILDQINLTVERAVDYRNAKSFDLGFKVVWLWGADSGLIHANGLFDWYDAPRKPENQFDLTEAFVDVVVPVGTGLRVRVGKFVNLVGYESIDPTQTSGGVIDFYSRSYVFGSGYPFTHIGVLGTYDVLRNVTVTAGVTRGDDQASEDNNDAVSFLGSVNWAINDKLSLYVSNSTGPEQSDNSRDLRTTFDATLYYNPNDRLSLAFNGYYLHDDAGRPDGGSGQLYSFAALAAYKVNDYVTGKGRIEWFHDNDGLRAPEKTDLYEVTVGATVTPFPHDWLGSNLKVRPELRYDFSDDRVFNGRRYQVTAGVDVVVKY